MNVLSLFDGISCGRVALERAGIHVSKYYASEVDKHVIKVSQNNYPDIIRLGDVQNWRDWNIDWSSIDLVLAGFPCQAWSMAGKQLGDRDERGMLFWIMLDIIANCPNADFLIENVKMKKTFHEYITHHTKQALGDRVYKILINSALVSAQNRNRYYWNSWSNEQPEDLGILVGDILNSDGELLSKGWHSWFEKNKEFQLRKKYSCIVNTADKAICMTARQYASWTGNFVQVGEHYRKLTPIECERLQTLPDNYTIGISNLHRYKALGNGWTVDVIAHLLRGVKAIGDVSQSK